MLKKRYIIIILILIILAILSFVIPVRIEYDTKAPTGPNAYLMGAIPVSEFYNIYGMKIYEK